MNIIFQINGGLGKNVMATAICKAIKIKYPESKLIVITGYPDVYVNNPNVDRCIILHQAKYFYQDFIENKEILYLGQEPYLTTSYIKNESNLIEIWCNMYDLPIPKLCGEIYLSKREIDFYTRKYNFKKPVLALQTNGNSGDMLYNWSRDMPSYLVKKIINNHSKDFDIVHIKNENQMSYDGTFAFTDNIRAVSVILSISKKRLFMDSCCQHLASALDLKSNVFWIATNHKVFGYENNNNILANPETKKVTLSNSFLSKYELVANISEFPYYDESEIFNEETLNSLI